MNPELLINLEEVNLQEMGMDILEQCPPNSTKEFSEGFHHFVCELFESLDSTLIQFQIEIGIAILPLRMFLEESLENLDVKIVHLNNFDKKEFLLGIDLAIEVSSSAIYSASLNYQKSA